VGMTLREFWSLYRLSEEACISDPIVRERAGNMLDNRSHVKRRKKKSKTKSNDKSQESTEDGVPMLQI